MQGELRVDEAMLTGESTAVAKSPVAGPRQAILADRTCMAYSGTLVTSGQGTGVVVATAPYVIRLKAIMIFLIAALAYAAVIPGLRAIFGRSSVASPRRSLRLRLRLASSGPAKSDPTCRESLGPGFWDRLLRLLRFGTVALQSREPAHPSQPQPRGGQVARRWGRWLRGEDSNLRRRLPTDLQSVPFDHSGTPPRT